MPYEAPRVPLELRERMRKSNSKALHRALQSVPVPVTAVPPWEEVIDDVDNDADG